MNPARSLHLLVAGLVFVGACAPDAEGAPAVAPPFEDGKADVGSRVLDRGPLGFDEAVTGEFVEDLEFHGYTLRARAGAVVTLDVTRTGSSRDLDSSLFVYGPRREGGGFGTAAIAFDDDAGWGRLSRLTAHTFTTQGEYLVVIGTANARGRGRYRLEARCESGDCLPTPPITETGSCHAALVERIEACVADWEADGEFAGSTRDLVEACADVEIVAASFDALCAGEAPPAALCAHSLESLSTEVLPGCAEEILSRRLDATCVFGAQYRDLFRPGALVVLSREVLTETTALSPLGIAQVIAAVDVSSWEPTTREEAFAAVDGGQIHRTALWDASGRRAFTALEYGAGDNSYGAIFAHGTLTQAARIQDGDLYGCETTWGPERRECASDAGCAEGLRCVGIAEPRGRGRCADIERREPGQDTLCSSESPCPEGGGLQCQGEPTHGEGVCRPAWLTASFEITAEHPIADNADTRISLLAYGLATVDVDVRLDLWIDHPRMADLQVVLVNPAGTEVVIADHIAGRELYLDDAIVRGLSGDESVNGLWTLIVRDTVRGQVGTVHRFGLTVTSRWD